jgi:hypothetical protein
MSTGDRGKNVIRNKRICYDCAAPINDPDAAYCWRCQGTDIDGRRTKPKHTARRETPAMPYPWNDVRLRLGGTIALSGNKGSGKTTICLAAMPTRILTSEQEPDEVKDTWYRIHPDVPCPTIHACYNMEQLYEDLLGLDSGDLVVVDSVSAMSSLHESTDVVKRVIERIRTAQCRCVFILQLNKEGSAFGPNELLHDVDATGQIEQDRFGSRRLVFTKNRHGALTCTYFELGAHGPRRAEFPYAYSVEGPTGDLQLHLYPLGGAKLGGIFETLQEHGVFLEGLASAAVTGPYRNGFAEPSDVDFRRIFAEQHGLTWVSPSDVAMILEMHKNREFSAAMLTERRGVSIG